MKILISSIFVFFFYLTFLFSPPPYVLSAMSLEKMDKQDKKNIGKADALFVKEEFKKALVLYSDLAEKYPDDIFLKYRAGICYLYKGDEREKAIPLLESVEASAPDFLEAKFYLGRAYHYQMRFEEATEKMKMYLQDENLERMDEDVIERFIEYAYNGILIMHKTTDWKIKNIGDEINTPDAEYSPLLSPDEDILYYTYAGSESIGGMHNKKGKEDVKNGEYYEDIYISKRKKSGWGYPISIAESINTPFHEAGLSVSIDGQRLFIYKSGGKGAKDIYISKNVEGEWTTPQLLEGDVNSDAWEGNACLSADGRTLFFSSDRYGGYGGKDLYKALLLPDGTWGNVKNLGEGVNSDRDEIEPYIHPDGKTLYYASDGHHSMGEHDIFVSKLFDGDWARGENMGSPINTPGDDRHFIMSMDKKRGYFSSEMKGGFGEQDIYMVYNNKIKDPTKLAYVKAKVLLDGKPAGADIFVKVDGEDFGFYQSNFSTGQTRIVFYENLDYEIKIVIPGVENVKPLVDKFAMNEVDEFLNVEHVFNLYTDEYTELTGNSGRDDKSMFEDIEVAEEKAAGTWIDPAIAIAEEKARVEKKKAAEEKAKAIENGEYTESTETASSEGEYHTPRGKVGACGGPIFIDFSRFIGVDLNNPTHYNSLVATAGNYCTDGLIFEVQIGAYRFPLNFKYPHLRSFGTAEIRDYPDQITRFTMGSYKTLKDAEKLRARIIKSGQFDAWITPFYNGKRHLMQELIAVNFYGKAIN